MDLGSLTASFGVDLSQLNQAEAGLQRFDQAAESTFSSAAGHVSSLGNELLALVGITLTVAAGFELVKKGIEEITSYNIGAISTSAMMLSRANIQGVDDQRAAYEGYKTYVLSMYEALEAETQRHFASGKEMIGGFDAFARKGIYAAQEEAGAIGVITDAVKLLHRGYVDEATMQHEIQGLLEGHAGIRFKLAQQLKGMMGDSWKEQVQAAAQNGTLLTFLEDKFKGLGVAAGDIQKNLQAQETTLSTLIGQIGRGGLGGLYEDIVGSVSSINDFLRENKTSIMVGIASAWQTVHDLIEKSVDLAGKLNTATSMNIPNAPQDRTLGQTAAVGFKEAFDPLNWANVALTSIKFLWDGIWQTIPEAQRDLEGLGNNFKLLLDWVLRVTEPVDRFLKQPWVIDMAGLKEDMDWLYGKVSWLVDIFSRAFTWVVNIKLEGLPSWLGGGPGATATLPGPEVSRGGKYIPYSPMPNYAEQLKITGGEAGVNVVAGPTGQYIGQTFPTAPPPWNPAKDAGKEKKGPKDTTDSTLASLQQKIDSLLQDIAKSTEGLDAGIDAWAVKAIDDINKVAAKNADNVEVQKSAEKAIALVRQDASAKKQKIDDDFWLKAAKNSGDVFVGLNNQYDKDLKDFGNTEARRQEIWSDYNKKYIDAGYNMEKSIEDLHKSNLQGYAQATPFLSDQLVIEKQILDIELRRNAADQERKMDSMMVWDTAIGYYRFLNEQEKNVFRAELQRTNLEKQAAQVRKGWETGGVSGGVNLFAMDLQKESKTAIALGVQNGLKSLKGAADQAITDMIMSPFTKKKIDFKKVGLDLATQFVNGWVKVGTTKLFDGLFNAFNIGAQKMTSTWEAAQQTMTAASTAGEAERTASVASGASQSTGILSNLAQGNIMIEAGRAAAGAFSSVMESVPFPFNAILAPIAAAAAFAGTMAFGSGLGGSGSGGSGTGGGPGEYSPGAYHDGGHLQPIYAHAGWPDLKPHEVPFIGLDTERVLNTEQTRDYEAGMRAGGGRSVSREGDTHIHGDMNFHVPASPGWTQDEWDRQAPMIKNAINKHIGSRGQKIGDGRF